MKNIFFLLLCVISLKTYSCDCNDPEMSEKYMQSDFVARITILKTYPNKGKESYKAKIKIDELYKGKNIKYIYINGDSKGNHDDNCGILISEKEKLVVYIKKNKYNKFETGYCTGILYLNGKHNKRINRELNILKTLKNKSVSFTNNINYKENSDLDKDLDKFKGIKLRKKFAFYEITFNSKLNIKKVKLISGFGKIDKQLKKIIEKTKWSRFNNEKPSPDNNKLLLGLYYYPKERGNKSFISTFYL